MMITECALAAHDTSEGAEFGEPAAQVDAASYMSKRDSDTAVMRAARRSATGTGGAPVEAITIYIINNVTTIST